MVNSDFWCCKKQPSPRESLWDLSVFSMKLFKIGKFSGTLRLENNGISGEKDTN
jgi:hypothetical protein